MKKIIIIPARYSSSRFPGKPLALIAGKPMIQHVYERVSKTEGTDGVFVATDNSRIYDCVTNFKGKVLMTSDTHSCGTDRLAECSEILGLDDEDIVLNIQGDEPLIRTETIMDLINIFNDPTVCMGTLKKEITDAAELNNNNVVKVICDKNSDAIYFSRYPIPFVRNNDEVKHYKHIGVYGYKKSFLIKYSQTAKTMLEKAESLEQLRVIENGWKIRVRETLYQTVGVDTPEQLKEAEKFMEANL